MGKISTAETNHFIYMNEISFFLNKLNQSEWKTFPWMWNKLGI